MYICLGLRYQCIPYVLYMYRHHVRWRSWGRDFLWAGWSGVWTPVGTRDYLLHTYLDRHWGPLSLITVGTGAFTWSHLLASFCRPFAWNTSASSGQIFMKFDNEIFFENLLKKSRLIKWWITGTLCQDLCTFITVSCWILPLRNVWYRSFRENQNENFMFHYIFF